MTDFKERLLSVDVLRGFDMLMIIFADRFFYALNIGTKNETTAFFVRQFSHPEWFGFHFYDIIMPLFLFVVGLVIPFSIKKDWITKSERYTLYNRILRRFCILFLLGWIVQGNILDLNLSNFHLFSNTLQAIAVGYVFTCLAYLHLSKKIQYFLLLVCLLVYTLILEWVPVPGVGSGVLLPDKNIAIYLDRIILGRFDDGLQYTWILTSLGFVATTLSGLFAGEVLRSGLKQKHILRMFLLIGSGMLVLGLLLSIWHPIVKKIWTSSFVLVSSGICYLLMALLYYFVDMKKYTNWAFPLKVIGMNAITAYVLSHVLDFGKIAAQILYGLEKYVGDFYQTVLSVGGFLILYGILYYMYRNRTFIRI
jgi:predicted acyltransferase